MRNYFADMISSFLSGGSGGISTGLFDLSFLLLIIAAAAYMIHLLRRSKPAWIVGFSALCAVIPIMTAALVLRWIAAGWEHPPWSNLYESLVFFSWGLIVSYAVVEVKYKVRAAGAFVVPLVMIAMGMASLSGNKEIGGLMPALQSIWLHLHVFSAAIGYAMFIVAFGFAVLYLFRDEVPLPSFLAASAAVNMLSILALTRGQVFLMRCPLIKSIFTNGKIEKVMSFETAKPSFIRIELPGLGQFLFITLILFAISLFMSWRAAKKGDEQSRRRSILFFIFPMILYFLVLAHMIYKSGRFPGFHLQTNIYSVALLGFTWIIGLLNLMLAVGGETMRETLPPAKILDGLTYKTIMVGFPILFFVILSGAIWANQAWGRYWGWDPKETASLVTWIVYLIYLHTRITKGWMGRRSAFIAIIGFVGVLFTYLGVNLLAMGLHSYATG